MALRAGRVGVAPDQVDGQGKVINAGGGGGGATKEYTFSVELLCEIDSPDTTTNVKLAHPITDYEIIFANGYGTYSGLITKCGNVYPTKYLSIGDGFGVSNDANVLWYQLVDNETIIGKVINMNTPRKFSVYGVKIVKKEES